MERTIKNDQYTKTVLTIIAICLVTLTIKQLDVFPKAYAGNPIENENLKPENYGLVPLNEDGTISVRLIDDEIDVNLVGIDTYDIMDVNIEEVGGYSFYNAIPVELEN
ncbi:MAG TPA: hypothetical protein VFM65_10085 [Flavobacteriaceae bacterium]|nr:hypothetical protein [Flavobacteriaceae bacterium]